MIFAGENHHHQILKINKIVDYILQNAEGDS